MKTDTVKGFRDFDGKEAEKREQIRKILVSNFEKYGFEPAETPIVENREFVQSGNPNDEAVSDIFKLQDRGKRPLALRYGLTFSLKRLMKNKRIPYKRYQIGPVFRDEPATKNRLRQFIQCDIDTIGATIKEEAEVLAVVKRVLDELGIKFTVYVNNRKLLNEILEKENIKKGNLEKVIRELDKIDKIPEKTLFNNLRDYGAQDLIKVFKQPEKEFEKYEAYSEIKELKEYCKNYGLKVQFQPSLARGLSYYNGNIFEVKSNIKETITAGGSYMFNGVQSTGLSFGLERLAILTDIQSDENRAMILSIDEDKAAIKLAEQLRNNNVSCTINYDRVGKALKYANAKEFPYVIFLGEDERKKKKVKLRDMKSGKERLLNETDLVKELI
jgi:histidyl-tRNA synthetase